MAASSASIRRLAVLATLLPVLTTGVFAAGPANEPRGSHTARTEATVKRPTPKPVARPVARDIRTLALATTDLSQGVTPEELVSLLLGPGITVSNITFSGAAVAAGKFVGGTGIIGFESGIVLGSGCIGNIVGPNLSDTITCDNGLPGDPQLDQLSGYPTQDAAILEFDFIPTDPNTTTLLFSYVFSSDEYNEWVYTAFNDVFAFYVNGQNCAVVPGPQGTPLPLTIDTVNGGNPYGSGNATNPMLFRNNDIDDGGPTIDTEMDGLSIVLSCQAQILPGVVNHIKLAIADASDGAYDSNVLLQTGSFTSTDLVITLGPSTAVNEVGSPHTVTAVVTDAHGVPQPDIEISFEVISGPNSGTLGVCSVSPECTTDGNGAVSFTYTGLLEGLDVIRACFDDVGGNDNCAPAVTKLWVLPCTIAPGEIDGGVLLWKSGATTAISWNAALGSTSTSVLRGLVSALPVGPGGGDESCLGTVPSTVTTMHDDTSPPAGDTYWYLVRGDNPCGPGTLGEDSNGEPRITATCPWQPLQVTP